MAKTKNTTRVATEVDKERLYEPAEALGMVRRLAFAKFDESIDVVFTLGIDARKADQLVRGTVSLPHGTGKTVRIAVFADGEQAKEAEEAGADIVGGQDLADQIAAGGSLNFDLAIATPSMMPVVGKLGPVLGPRGLMPNPKSGTVTQDVGKAVSEFKAGKVEYRNDRYGNVHVPVGRVSFEADQLLENLGALSDEIMRAKPAVAKGRYMRKVAVSSTMGPGLRIDPGEIELLVKELR
jgi:large subunit ribosomal protein L1